MDHRVELENALLQTREARMVVYFDKIAAVEKLSAALVVSLTSTTPVDVFMTMMAPHPDASKSKARLAYDAYGDVLSALDAAILAKTSVEAVVRKLEWIERCGLGDTDTFDQYDAACTKREANALPTWRPTPTELAASARTKFRVSVTDGVPGPESLALLHAYVDAKKRLAY